MLLFSTRIVKFMIWNIYNVLFIYVHKKNREIVMHKRHSFFFRKMYISMGQLLGNDVVYSYSHLACLFQKCEASNDSLCQINSAADGCYGARFVFIFYWIVNLTA